MIAIRMLLVWTALCGVIYPLTVTGIARLLFPRQAAGSLVIQDGLVIGSELIGRDFHDPRYFWSRPSATPASPYNSQASSGSNLGPKSSALAKSIEDRRKALLAAGPAGSGAIPVDLLTSSASGLDPHISPEAATWQVPRVAHARGVDASKITELVRRHTSGRQFGMLGEPVVNVFLLNQDLDRQ